MNRNYIDSRVYNDINGAGSDPHAGIESLLPQAFTPAIPIAHQDRLQGRSGLLENLKRAWAREGASVALYGAPGVGKTSAVKVASRAFPGCACYHSASADDTFATIVSELLQGFDRSSHTGSGRGPVRSEKPETISPNSVVRYLPEVPALFIIDDFERIRCQDTRRAFADLAKKISDVHAQTRLTFVGVGDNVKDLLLDHRSVSRQIMALKVPKLSQADIRRILQEGAAELGIEFDVEALRCIEALSGNKPCHTHLLAEGAVHNLVSALRQGTRTDCVIGTAEVEAALKYSRETGQFPMCGQGSAFSRAPHAEKPDEPAELACHARDFISR